MPDITQIIQNGGPEISSAVLFFLFLFGTFVSEDAACILAGSAVAGGHVSFAFAVTACFLGIFAGDMLLFGAGRVFGEKALNYKIVRRFVSERSQAKAKSWLERNAASAVFLSRFITGLRLPTYIAAGAFRTGFAKFALFFLLASAIWTPVLVGSAAFSQRFIFPQNAFVGLAVTVILIRLVLKYSSRKNRRLLKGRLDRIVKWEFWPMPIFYLPVVIYVFLIALKHRSLTAFTAANPAIPAGGFKGESKSDIYNGLGHSTAARAFLLKHTLIDSCWPTAKRLEQAWRFIDNNRLWFPLAVKPDCGERGKGVSIVRSLGELESAVISAEKDLIIQEFAAGSEISAFYYRFPTDRYGRIFSITEKTFPTVIGDGESTFEELILKDERAVCLAEKYFAAAVTRPEHIPAAGEAVTLIDIGTHSRGAVFLDGDRFKTKLLEQTIDEICRGFKGFYFGRFDIRAESFEDLEKGRNFKIIELNGVTSESTNIYDPRYSLTEAYRILFQQWRIAFEIGSENIKLGARRTKFMELLKLTFGIDTISDRISTGSIDMTRTRNDLECA